MAITFPRSLPDELKTVALSLMLKPTGMGGGTRGGKQIWADTGPALWHGDLESTNLTQEEFGVACAFFETLLSEKEFYGYDRHREYPVAHKSGWGNLTVSGSPFSGAGLIATGSSAFSLNLKSLPAGLILTAGDRLAFDYDDGTGATVRALHRIVAGGTVSGSTLTVEVRPALRSGFATNATVYFYQPAARMLVLPDSYAPLPAVDGSGRISLKAVQSL